MYAHLLNDYEESLFFSAIKYVCVYRTTTYLPNNKRGTINQQSEQLQAFLGINCVVRATILPARHRS